MRKLVPGHTGAWQLHLLQQDALNVSSCDVPGLTILAELLISPSLHNSMLEKLAGLFQRCPGRHDREMLDQGQRELPDHSVSGCLGILLESWQETVVAKLRCPLCAPSARTRSRYEVLRSSY